MNTIRLIFFTMFIFCMHTPDTHADTESVITTNMTDQFLSAWIDAANGKSRDDLSNLIEPTAQIRVMLPVSREKQLLSRDEWLDQLSKMWSMWSSYKLTVERSSLEEGRLFVRITQNVKSPKWSVTRSADEVMEFSVRDGELKVRYMQIIPDKEAVKKSIRKE